MEEKRVRVSPSKAQADYLKFIGAFEAPAPSPALAPHVSKVTSAAGTTRDRAVSTPARPTFFTACCILILVILALLLLGS